MADTETQAGARTPAQPITMHAIAQKLEEVHDLVKLGLQQTEDSTASVQNAVFHQEERLIWAALAVARHHAETEVI